MSQFLILQYEKQRFIIEDNVGFGDWDYDLLADAWDVDLLSDWGVDIPSFDTDLDDEIASNEDANVGHSDDGTCEIAERFINEAIRIACGEVVEQFNILQGFSFITKHNAKINFIKFLYYGREYNRYNSLAFHANQYITSGDGGSTYNGLKAIYESKIKAERIRFVTGDDLSKTTRGSLAFNGYKMPLDFPASLARDLINKYCVDDGAILDPCSGWGGRLVGFLASKAKEYQGVDASPYQVENDMKIYECYKDVLKGEKIVNIACSPFEKYDAMESYFDFALTSPPYFDTEKYIGGEQSHSTNSNYDSWRESFYVPLIQKVYNALKDGCVFCLQIGSQRYPLLNDGKEIASSVGFVVENVIDTGMHNNFNETEIEDGEVIIVLRK